LTFIGFPGLGKSYFSEYLSKNLGSDVNVQGVKSDLIWKSLIEDASGEKSKANIFSNKGGIKNHSIKKYKSRLHSCMVKMCGRLKPGRNMICIDKCNNGEIQLKEYTTNMRSQYNITMDEVKIVVCIPKVEQPLTY
jgi:mannose/fructose/N-acetylgalactosamine-specific phosphotransferase system component IIB